MACPVDHLSEWQTPPTIRLGLGPLLHCGFVYPVAWSTLNTHGLRVSAVAPDEGSSLRMQISTVQAMPLRLPSVHHMTCGVIFLTIRCLWRAPPLLWAFTAPCHLPQKESALLLTMMPHMVLLRGVRSGTDTNGGPPTIRGQQKPRMTWQCLLHGRAWRLLTRYEYMIHGRRRNEQPHRSWQLQTGNGEPSLPPPRPAGPCLGRGFETPPPPAEQTAHLLVLRCGPLHLHLELFSSSDLKDGRMWDLASVRHRHVTVKSDKIASISLATERRSGASQLLPILIGLHKRYVV